MSNSTSLRGLCPTPFFDESKFPLTGGYVGGRLCSPIPGVDLTCCLPCPATDYLYPNDFYKTTRIPGFIALGSLALCVFVLLAFLILPQEHTKRHYLNTSLTISIVMLELGLAVPVLAKPEQCHNEITARDMNDSMTCAWSGALIIAGGCAANMWILMRVLAMHLQVCWDVSPTKFFFYGAQLLAWGVTAALTTVCLSITGVSFRFGDYCQVNSYKALDTLWGPLLGISGLVITIQLCTFGYCLKVYLQNLLEDHQATTSSGPSQVSSSRRGTARAVYQRVRRVLSLQWRSLAISALVAADVVFLAVVFLVLNKRIDSIVGNFQKMEPWVFCVVSKSVEECLPFAEDLRPRESILIATLILLSVVGIQTSLLISRRNMITGWYTCSRDWIKKRNSFVFLDERQDPMIIGYPTPVDEKKAYELSPISTVSTIASPISSYKSPTTDFRSPVVDSLKTPASSTKSPLSRHGDGTDLFDTYANPFDGDLESNVTHHQAIITRERSLDRRYHPSRYSFSSPRPPSAGQGAAARAKSPKEAERPFPRPAAPTPGDGLGVTSRTFPERDGAISRTQR